MNRISVVNIGFVDWDEMVEWELKFSLKEVTTLFWIWHNKEGVLS